MNYKFIFMINVTVNYVVININNIPSIALNFALIKKKCIILCK